MDITLFSDVKPTWKMLPFNEGKEMIPAPQKKWRENSNDPIICPMMIGNSLVFRKFQFPKEEIKRRSNAKELSRFVFYEGNIVREDADGSWRFITVDELKALDDYYDCYQALTCYAQKTLLQEFINKAIIANKRYILMAMRLADSKYHFLLSSFLEIYKMAQREEREFEGVPDRIVKELLGRGMECGRAVRIAKDLVVVTGNRFIPLFGISQQTRAYFDKSKAYFFGRSPLTGTWISERDTDYFRDNKVMRERCIDSELFENTCMERFVGGAIEHKFKGDKKVNYGQLMVQSLFLSAEQAFKVNEKLYGLVVDNIFDGNIRDGKLTLPKLLGITGSQIKFMEGIDIPRNLNQFANCMKDPEFIKYYPDVQKRIFAASAFLNGRSTWFMTRDISREELFEASKTMSSLQKITDKEKRDRILGEYLDYVKMRRTYLQYLSQMQEDDPLFEEITKYGEAPLNLKPSIIKDRHDKIGRIVEVIKCADQIDKYTEAISQRKENEAEKREYKSEKYSVIMPRDAKDIIMEGRILEHCVGRAGYIEAMAHGSCTILFVRANEKIEVPLITMEERGGAIRQCYGFRDSYNSDPEIGRFISDYAARKGLKIEATIYSPVEKAG